MKKVLLAGLLSLTAMAANLNNSNHARVFNGVVSVSQGDDIVMLDEDFSGNMEEKWILPHKIFENFTWIHQDPTNNVPTLRIERNPKRVPPEKRLFDTAWELRTKVMPLPEKAALLMLETQVFSNQPEMVNATGHGNSYKNAVIWLDAEGIKIRDERFSFNVAAKYPALSLTEFVVPQGATQVQLTIGADEPDLLVNEFVAFSKVKLSAIPRNGRYSPQATFETCPMRIDGKVALDADIPNGTSVNLQVAVAPEVDSVPGTWSEFKNLNMATFPAGIAKDARWMKLKVTLNATNDKTPEIRAIRIGEKTILDQWSLKADNQAPVVLRQSASPTENIHEAYVMQASDENPISWNKFTVSINGVDMNGKYTRELDKITIPAPAEGWKKGVNVVAFSIEDTLGNKVDEKQVFYIGEMRKNNIVTMRDDGMTLLDGKPFFPLGMACAVKCAHNDNSYEKLFEMFEEAGMNFARHYSGFSALAGDAKEYISAADKHGIKLYYAAGRGANDTDIQKLAEHLAKQINATCLAWDTGDDTSMHITSEQMRQRYNAIKAIDPYRITTQADPLGAFAATRYRPYALYSDNFSPEIYPVHNDSEQDKNAVVPAVVSSMEAIKADWKAVNAPVRSCWPLIQYFYNTGSWKRLQTTEELRCMSYQAIIHGATGVIWYRYAGYNENNKTGFTPEQWNRIVTVSKELRRLYDVLCERACKEQPGKPAILAGPKVDVFDNCSISLLLKHAGKERMLFAASSVRKDVKARITIPAGATSVVDFFDGHACKVNADGSFEDDFKPLDVHVYTVK